MAFCFFLKKKTVFPFSLNFDVNFYTVNKLVSFIYIYTTFYIKYSHVQSSKALKHSLAKFMCTLILLRCDKVLIYVRL